jgi:hypothetical protein
MDVRSSLLAALIEMGATFTADNVEAGQVSVSDAEVTIVASKDACAMLSMSEAQLRQAAQRAFGRALRIKLVAGTPPPQSTNAPSATRRQNAPDEELLERALADPTVSRFREVFPDAEVRQVRNLKES